MDASVSRGRPPQFLLVSPPLPPPGKMGADYDTAWARRYPARLVRAALLEGVMRPTMSAIASPDRRGLDRLDDLNGPVVFVANHHSHADTPLLLTSIPEPWRHRVVVGAAADYFFGNRFSGAVSALAIGAVPIERTRVGRRSADMARDLIDDGWSVLLYPEGGRKSRRVGTGVSWWCRLPCHPVRGPGSTHPPPRDRPNSTKGPNPAPTVAYHSHLR
ncbi:MAG: hypothetical protein CM1200mP26_30870 [Acidimicrobiales bacterium]|nr:MAG: hypothetical protein CM1200mP26_30870 [Acidimicrobiales bacterium]